MHGAGRVNYIVNTQRDVTKILLENDAHCVISMVKGGLLGMVTTLELDKEGYAIC